MIFRKHFTVNTHDTDYNGELRPSKLLMHMQEAANLQLEEMKPSNAELRERGLSFILSRIAMNQYRPIYACNDIEVQTWASDSHGLLCNRCYRVLLDGEIVAEAISVWGLMALDTRKPVKVSEVGSEYSPEPMLELDLPRRFVIPADAQLHLVGEHKVTYAETDRNMHMNNTCYPDMFCDYLDLTKARPASVLINYNAEAPMGTSLKIYMANYDGCCFFRSVRPDGKTNAEARFILD
jgi:medium-chain acyl-[acyl-carrier-protein] hydrolase